MTGFPNNIVVNDVPYPHVTVTKGGSGYFAVMLWWCPEMGGFPEPYDTGTGRYGEPEPAECEARGWAKNAGFPFVTSPYTVSAVNGRIDPQ